MTLPPSQDRIVAALRHVLPQARGAWLFGSAAAGRFGPDSDLDIAVDLPTPLSPTTKWDAAERLAAQLGADVDLLDFRRLSTVMQHQVLATGRLLFSLDPVALAGYCGFVLSEYQHMQAWRQPMVKQLAQRLMRAGSQERSGEARP
ncbi:type VII toxin-antitoxin system MntA family adenylyltransferase antitoxin [Pseudacidovorax intermedius]|uniref:type VII toxin-antitoxin system MntA family adenylyltransferase antitoxin n=1 Tax=Pseudacidovorax intermedius TaxID=433924 RepID=UPI000734CC7C|nr:nucleotidyltransferase domain-containing protein [Pseudacidovorax intermedius]